MMRRSLGSNSDNNDVWVRIEDLFELAKMSDDGKDSIRGAAKAEQMVDVIEVD